MRPEERLAVGVERMGLSLDEAVQSQLIEYVQLLMQWNKAFNLTAVRDADGMVVRHLLDSLSVLPHIDGQSALDLGTGAGLPGVVLAICNPKQHWTLLDSNGKKTRFLTQARISLGINNVTVVNARVEKWQNTQLYDSVTSRAFTDLEQFVSISSPLTTATGSIWAMVGKQPNISADENVSTCRVSAIHRLVVPFSEGERHLVHLQHNT